MNVFLEDLECFTRHGVTATAQPPLFTTRGNQDLDQAQLPAIEEFVPEADIQFCQGMGTIQRANLEINRDLELMNCS